MSLVEIPSPREAFFRGGTLLMSTTFTDFFGNPINPGSATINIVYPDPGIGTDETAIAMTPPATGYVWTAEWDTRNVGIGTVSCSVHSDPGTPYAVEDFSFELIGNPANLLTFT